MSFVDPNPDARPGFYQHTADMFKMEAQVEEYRAPWEFAPARTALFPRILAAIFETLAETFQPKAHFKRAQKDMEAARRTPEHQELLKVLADYPELVLSEDPQAMGEWKLSYFRFIDDQRRSVPAEARRGRATAFVAYLECRFKPWVAVLEKDLRTGAWREGYPEPKAWQREVPELLRLPSRA